ncbi:hypothetical protein Drorol1_Dr00000972 [Drosera rotundifolia]
MSMAEEKHILVTGGAGFIGTHTVHQLLVKGFRVMISDNLQNSSEEVVKRVTELVGTNLSKKLVFNKIQNDIEKLFSANKFDAVIHFVGLKAVGENVAYPFRYFDNNLIGSINLYQIMVKYNCKKVSEGHMNHLIRRIESPSGSDPVCALGMKIS